ncbi:hypothetical protein [Paenibacillus alba]|uniref:DUF3298 domain-containing protein n=1 Tax=Paenibacillus alba TaxID=1197127 RepID=A0ABU6GA40_9BACL|nr:hypothetical protein [Paenibacillus alba]MEC0229599.1 hypothetical protein [Paenibacillus alba]
MLTADFMRQEQPKLWELALRLAPALYMDTREPFVPIRVGVTAFEESGPSQSFPRTIKVDHARVKVVVEYAIYWDYDIQHIYDLEHVWVYIGHNDEIISCEVSFHGKYMIGLLSDRSNIQEDGRVQVYVQPGKHAMAALDELFRLLPDVEAVNNELAGNGGVLENEMFQGQFKFGANIDKLAEDHLRTFSFQPSFIYTPYEWTPDMFVTWDELKAEIPVRMRALLESLSN